MVGREVQSFLIAVASVAVVSRRPAPRRGVCLGFECGETGRQGEARPVRLTYYLDTLASLAVERMFFEIKPIWENAMNNQMIPDFLGHTGGKPNLDFFWKEVAGKRRLIGNPNKAMRVLHQLLGEHLVRSVRATRDNGYGVRKLPSATGCVPRSNPTINAEKHRRGKFFYITDLRNAYPSVDLERLALIIVFLSEYAEYDLRMSLKFFLDDERKELLKEDPLFQEILLLLRYHFAGLYGKGLAVGGPLSPYLMNLYCEVYLDSRLRRWCEKNGVIYTRYVDDLVFSAELIITTEQRKEIRRFIGEAGFEVNHRKSKVLTISQGAVFITKVGLEKQHEQDSARIVFPQKKRCRLHGAIMSYLALQMDWPEKVSGLVAEFLYYYKNVAVKTATDQKTFQLCKDFEAEWARYRNGPAPRRLK